jgi:hypothetical protein
MIMKQVKQFLQSILKSLILLSLPLFLLSKFLHLLLWIQTIKQRQKHEGLDLDQGPDPDLGHQEVLWEGAILIHILGKEVAVAAEAEVVQEKEDLEVDQEIENDMIAKNRKILIEVVLHMEEEKEIVMNVIKVSKILV